MRIAVANLKGGVGKTTTAVHLAAGLGRQAPTVLLDVDPSAQATRWAQLAPELPYLTVSHARTDIGSRLRSVMLEYGEPRHLVIDTPPLHEAIVTSAVEAVDLLLIPTQPRFMDLDRVGATISLLATFKRTISASVLVLLTMVRSGTADSVAARQFLEGQGFQVLDTEIPLLAGYYRSFGEVPPEGTRYGQLLDELLAKEAVPA
ncbi:MAG: ParA family protein [Candidatus Dormibacteraeota bacterium]|nr:ParA family protein [Candidatus Dormibacteraeota bacterium]MBJ7610876.1 ParA family protein [Candidatus Dormibacteraeota bacterium]